MRARYASISATIAAPYELVVARSATKISELETAVVALDEPLHLRPSRGELAGCRAEALDALLEQSERLGEVELIALELVDDPLEPLESCLEGHFLVRLRHRRRVEGLS